MDWERFLQDGVVPLEKSLDDSHYHEKGTSSPSVSPIPAASSLSKYQYQSDEEERELRRMKKGKAK